LRTVLGPSEDAAIAAALLNISVAG
jgi:hypothetical protein